MAVAFEQRTGMRGGEILPLQTGAGQFLLDCLHKSIHELVIGVARDAFMPPAQVVRIGRHRAQSAACAQDECRQLACTARACRSECQARRRLDRHIGDDDHIDIAIGPVAQQGRYRIAQRIRPGAPARRPACRPRALSLRYGRAAAGKRGPHWCPAGRADRCGVRGRRFCAGTSGGSRPCKPRAVRSSLVKAVPRLSVGELSSEAPRSGSTRFNCIVVSRTICSPAL